MDTTKTAAPQESKLHFLDYWRIIRIRKTVILAVFFLVFITATLVTFILPESFAGVASIRVERDQSDISGVLQNQGFNAPYDPYFINTEFELIQSEVILNPVIEKLNLTREWAAKDGGGQPLKTHEALQILQGKMSLNQVRSTSLIEIRVRSDKAEEAAKLANAIAEEYRDYRVAKRRELTEHGVEVLEKRWKEQELKVSEAQSNVDWLRKELKVPDNVVNADAPSTLMTSDTLRREENLRIDGEKELAQQETLFDSLTKLNPKVLEQTFSPRCLTAC